MPTKDRNIAGRYSRQELLKQIGKKGQIKLGSAKVAIVGIGALGCVAAQLLARAGIGSLLLIDRDIVEESNLQRQIIFEQNDVGKSKAAVAAERLRQINSSITISAQAIHLSAHTIDLLRKYDLILDCTDNLTTRFLLNDFCKKEKIPWIYAAAIKTSGQVFPILPRGPCLRCFLKEASVESCSTAGVLNTVTTIIASLQATLALQLLLNYKVVPLLHYVDVWSGENKKIKINKNDRCPTCNGTYIYLQPKDETRVVTFCSGSKYQVFGKPVQLNQIQKRWEKLGPTQRDTLSISFKNILLFKDGRALINAASEQEALSFYSTYVGN